MFNIFGECFVILTAIIIIAVALFLVTPEKPPIFNIYRTPSGLYWLKVGILYIFLYLNKLSQIISTPNEVTETLDKPQKLPPNKNAIDGVYFNGSNTQGDRFSISIARRNNNKTETHTIVKIGSLKVLVHVDNPHTCACIEQESNKFSINGFNIVSIIPTRKWKITYNGKMKDVQDGTLHNVHLNLTFTSKFPMFNYCSDIDYLLYAKAIALESWNVEYFNILNELHLQCYGQFGQLNGKVSIDGQECELNMDAYRDHTIANNFNWATYHRYIVHYINVENGDRIVIKKLSQPIVTSNFSQGFMYRATDRKYYPLQKCNLELYQHGEVEEPSVDYAFSFDAGDQQYTVQVNIGKSVPCYLGKDWSCKLLERHCSANVNGNKAWGSCQWLYRNVYGVLSKSM